LVAIISLAHRFSQPVYSLDYAKYLFPGQHLITPPQSSSHQLAPHSGQQVLPTSCHQAYHEYSIRHGNAAAFFAAQ
jgi:hypothetical protein